MLMMENRILGGSVVRDVGDEVWNFGIASHLLALVISNATASAVGQNGTWSIKFSITLGSENAPYNDSIERRLIKYYFSF